MKYAVIRVAGKQYRVSEGDTISVDRLPDLEKSSVTFNDVLLFRDEESVQIGTPMISKGKVLGEIVQHYKGDKIRISKFKAKVRFRKTIGFRPYYTKVKVNKITAD